MTQTITHATHLDARNYPAMQAAVDRFAAKLSLRETKPARSVIVDTPIPAHLIARNYWRMLLDEAGLRDEAMGW
jgi:hypothetical protein